MTDKTKAISGGWVAPYYDEACQRFAAGDILVITGDTHLLISIDDVGMDAISLDQAKALIDALQQAMTYLEEPTT